MLMRRHCFFILLLSLLIPLQAVAGMLLNAPCPDSGAISHTAMPMKEAAIKENVKKSVMTDKTAAAMDNMPCCPDQTKTQSPTKSSPCKNVTSCHLCKTPGQIYLFNAVNLASNRSLADAVITPTATLSVFNPAGIWRPPSIT